MMEVNGSQSLCLCFFLFLFQFEFLDLNLLLVVKFSLILNNGSPGVAMDTGFK